MFQRLEVFVRSFLGIQELQTKHLFKGWELLY